MATFEITISEEKIDDLLQGDRGMGDQVIGNHVMAALLEPVLNQMLQAEMTEFLQAGRGERTEGRQGYRNGSYTCQAGPRPVGPSFPS